MRKSSLRNFFGSKNIFLYSCLTVTFAFFITRLPYFLDFPVIILSSDTSSYCAIALRMLEGQLPVFDIRTPGYPVFLFLIWNISKSLFSVSLVQSLFTLASAFFFLYVISRTFRSLTFLFAISLVGYITSSYFLILEVSILSEGIFPGLFLLNAGFLILCLKENKTGLWIAYSVSVAALVLVRPASLFLCAIIFLIFIFFLINRYSAKFYAYALVPFASIMIALCSYNYFTLKQFTITPFGEANLSGATILFMEESPEYSDSENLAIRQTLGSISKKDISYVKDSFGISKLYYSFHNNYYRQLLLTENLMSRDTSLKFTDVQPIVRKISFDAISKHPGVYAKFFMVNFLFFFNNVKVTMNYFEHLENVFKRTILEDKYIKELDSGRWKQISGNKSDNVLVKDFFSEKIAEQKSLKNFMVMENGEVELKDTPLKKVYNAYEVFYNFIFRNILWLILYGIVFLLSVIGLIKSKFKSVNFFIPFLFCIIYLTKAVLVSLVEASLVRYSYPVEFVIFFSLPFLFLILREFKSNQLRIKN